MSAPDTHFCEPQLHSREADDVSSPLQPQKLNRNEIHLWYADLDEPIEPHILSASEEKRARSFRFPILRSRFRATRTITRIILSRYLDRLPHSLAFTETELGKPQLAGLPPEGAQIRFNLSHSGSSYLLGICLRHEIGVDIEQRRAIEDRDELVQRFFHSNEVKAFQQIPEKQKDEAFLLAWTRKEAILKATGVGLTEHLDSLQVTLDPRKECRLLSIHTKWGALDKWNLFTSTSSASSISSVATPYRFEKYVRRNFTTPT